MPAPPDSCKHEVGQRAAVDRAIIVNGPAARKRSGQFDRLTRHLGVAVGIGGEAGLGYLTGIWGLNTGIYLDYTEETVGVYVGGNASAGVGMVFSSGTQVSHFSNLDSFGGWGAGMELDTPLGSVSTTRSLPNFDAGGVTTISSGGFQAFVGATLTYTKPIELFSVASVFALFQALKNACQCP